jgi:hypothetical protein
MFVSALALQRNSEVQSFVGDIYNLHEFSMNFQGRSLALARIFPKMSRKSTEFPETNFSIFHTSRARKHSPRKFVFLGNALEMFFLVPSTAGTSA